MDVACDGTFVFGLGHGLAGAKKDGALGIVFRGDFRDADDGHVQGLRNGVGHLACLLDCHVEGDFLCLLGVLEDIGVTEGNGTMKTVQALLDGLFLPDLGLDAIGEVIGIAGSLPFPVDALEGLIDPVALQDDLFRGKGGKVHQYLFVVFRLGLQAALFVLFLAVDGNPCDEDVAFDRKADLLVYLDLCHVYSSKEIIAQSRPFSARIIPRCVTMKAMVLGDTHGDVSYLRQALAIFEKERLDRLYLTGDLLPESVRMLDFLSGKIVAVSGNCDNYYQTEEYANFPMPLVNYTGFNGKTVAITHGHLYDAYSIPIDYDILILGHSHVSSIASYRDRLILNPGSLAQPRDGIHSYMIMDEKSVRLYDIVKGRLVRTVDF